MYHGVSPFHARKIVDDFLQSEHKKVFEPDDVCNIHSWHDQLRQRLLPTLLIPLSRKEIDALKMYATYWQIYKKHIMTKFDEIRQNPSSLDTFPKRLLSVIEMHFKHVQTPHADTTKWGERFNYSQIDGMQRHTSSIQSLQRKLSDALSSMKRTEHETIYVVPKLSTEMLLPFDSIYESLDVFRQLDAMQHDRAASGDGCALLRSFDTAIWNSLRLAPSHEHDELDVVDIVCRSGQMVKQFNLALLKLPDAEYDADGVVQQVNPASLLMLR